MVDTAETAAQPPRHKEDRVPEKLWRLVEHTGVVREYDEGELIMPPGDHGEFIRFLLSGGASVILRYSESHDITVDTISAGDMFGEISFLTGRPMPSDTALVALEPCRVREVPAEFFQRILHEHPDLAVALLKSLAVKVMRLDRSVFSTKLKKQALKSLISRQDSTFPDYVIGEHARRQITAKLKELADSAGPVLISGETGVGKEAIAHKIYSMSNEYKDVFLLDDLFRMRSEVSFGDPNGTVLDIEDKPTEQQMRLFFGEESRSPEGKLIDSPGHLDLTENGTLLIRGAELLTAVMQQKMLDAIVTGYYSRYGGSKIRQVVTRVICTTELSIDEITPDRHPLLHGLLDRSVEIPPLRKRRREITDLVDHYLNLHCAELQRPVPELPKQTIKILVNYAWPGNDLELSNTIRRALVVSKGNQLLPDDISFDIKRTEGEGKLNLLNFKPVRQAVLSPLFPATLQSAVAPFFFILLVLLFLGPADPKRNMASLFSWALGWPALVIGAFFWGRFWCTLCPMGSLSNLAKRVISWEIPFPAFLKNRSDFVVAAGVLFIIWLETATDIRSSPFNLGLLILTIFLLAVAMSVIFERQSWCRYLCPLGGLTGVLAKTAIIELRADRNVCVSQCASHDCYHGSMTREGCPFGQLAPTVTSNLGCKICGACAKNCPHGAVNLNLRVPGQELWEMRFVAAGTAFLVLGMIGGLLSEILAHTDMYEHIAGHVPGPEIVQFTIVFIAIIGLLNLGHAIVSALSQQAFSDTFHETYTRFALALLPLTLTAFAAFHLYYLINLGVHFPIILSQNFDFEIFRQLIITVPPRATFFIQELLIWAGLAWTLFVMYRLARAVEPKLSLSLAGLAPQAAFATSLAFVLIRAMEVRFYGWF